MYCLAFFGLLRLEYLWFFNTITLEGSCEYLRCLILK